VVATSPRSLVSFPALRKREHARKEREHDRPLILTKREPKSALIASTAPMIASTYS
jgi:hypothetical protein